MNADDANDGILSQVGLSVLASSPGSWSSAHVRFWGLPWTFSLSSWILVQGPTLSYRISWRVLCRREQLCHCLHDPSALLTCVLSVSLWGSLLHNYVVPQLHSTLYTTPLMFKIADLLFTLVSRLRSVLWDVNSTFTSKQAYAFSILSLRP